MLNLLKGLRAVYINLIHISVYVNVPAVNIIETNIIGMGNSNGNYSTQIRFYNIASVLTKYIHSIHVCIIYGLFNWAQTHENIRNSF